MLGLILVGFLAGIIAGISPCILPVLPIIFVAGAAPTPKVRTAALATAPAITRSAGREAVATAVQSQVKRRRPWAVVAGLIVSFSFFVLAGSEVLSLLDLPQNFLRDAGIVVLVLVGIGFLVPQLGALIERPFARLGARQPGGEVGGFLLGLALGALFVPCAGPVLAAITVVGATHRVGLTAVFLTVAFALGAAIPLMAIALAGDQLTHRVAVLRQRRVLLQQLSGLVLIAMAVAIGFNAFAGLQRDLPGYTNALQKRVEGSPTVRQQLGALTGNGHGSLAKCSATVTSLEQCGPAPKFTDVTAWLNTPADGPLTIAGLKGKVVLVDFWTYSCINCQRTLPHVEAWYNRYKQDGLVVVGVSTPEFAFEHVVSNVKTAAGQLGVDYPIAVDDNYGTWDAYDNEYWPADYLIDSSGDVRHVSFGEGGYSDTEQLIRQLLTAAHPGLKLPPPTSVPDLTPTSETNPETYVGYTNLQYKYPNNDVTRDAPATYVFPGTLPLGALGFSGVWTDHAQEATAGANAELELGFEANDVYLVLGGTGTLQVSIDGRVTKTIDISGIPKLYTLFAAGTTSTGTMTLRASPGVQAYDFTFG